MATNRLITPGIHHITAITADAQQNINFYCGILGLRLVKLTVNFDDPGSYHLYYGDESGSPGTVLTFFAWPGAYRGRIGVPQVTTTAFSAPADSLDFWTKRLQAHGIAVQPPTTRFGDQILAFTDPDGMQLEIVAAAGVQKEPWRNSPIAPEHALRGFHGATMSEEGYEKTAQVLTELMGFKSIGSEQNRFRYSAGSGESSASTIDLLCVPDARRGSLGAGIVHHIAFRTTDDAEQTAWRQEIVRAGLNVSPVMDRTYFHSIYFREPGGVLFEIASDGPGFTADESLEKLGRKLMLPSWMESQRQTIESSLPPLQLPP